MKKNTTFTLHVHVLNTISNNLGCYIEINDDHNSSFDDFPSCMDSSGFTTKEFSVSDI